MKLIRADYLIADPGLHERGIIQDGALVFEDGKVVAVGPWLELESHYSHLEPLFPSENRLVIPGLVDAHHHGRALDTRQVGMADKPLETWLPSFILYPGFDPYNEARLTAVRLLGRGVTTSLVAHSHPGSWDAYERSVRRAVAAYVDAGVRVAFAPGHYDQHVLVHEDEASFFTRLPEPLRTRAARTFDPETAYTDTSAYFDLFESLLEDYASHPQVRLLLNPIGLHWASDGLRRRIAQVKDDLGVGLHLHLLETQIQRAYAANTFGISAAEVLHRYGLLNPSTSLAHGIWSSERDADLYATTGTTVVTNPSSNQRLGSGRLPLSLLQKAGVPLALGTDSMGLLDPHNLPFEMTLFQALHRIPEADRWPSPFEVLEHATLGGANAATFTDIGKLLPGYQADITVLNLERFTANVASDSVELALEQVRADDVQHVLVGGKWQVRDGQLVEDVSALETQLQAGSKDVSKKIALLQELEPHLIRFYHDKYGAFP